MPNPIGDCDACPRTNVELFKVSNDMLCEKCRDGELEAMAEERKSNARVNHVIEQSRRQDQGIKVSQDVFNASTTDFITLRAAVENDEDIPADKKKFKMAELAAERITQFDSAIFAKEQELMEMKNQRHAWRTQATQLVHTLSEAERTKFRALDVNYKPATPAATKKIRTSTPTGPKAGTKKFDKAALREAARKYNVAEIAVQSLWYSKSGISYEEAAKQVLALAGPLPSPVVNQ
jgi:hypothetical protein